tara:strand:- start:354 stop:539 length:186 start_codon:yes stop_codon:yes gene_type:complete
MGKVEFNSRLNDRINQTEFEVKQTLISQCQDGLISVDECMTEIIGVELFKEQLQLSLTEAN